MDILRWNILLLIAINGVDAGEALHSLNNTII
jgi:hypothetical protein